MTGLLILTLLAISLACAFYGTNLLTWTIAMAAGIVVFGVTGAVPIISWMIICLLYTSDAADE